MKFLAKNLLVGMICFQMVALPAGPARAETAASRPVESHAAIRLLRAEVEQNPAFYYRDEALTEDDAVENKGLAIAGIREILARLEDSSYPLESVREELLSQMVSEEEAQLVELKYVVNRMPPETLDGVFEAALERGAYSGELRAEYASAYSAAEKRDIVLGMIRGDLFNVKSATMKRLGLLDREGLIRELKLTETLLNTKGRDTWKIVLVVVVAVAAAGFASWGIVSASKKHWERRTRETEDDFRRREEDERKSWADRETELRAMFEERARLRDQGYVWTVCSTTENAKSVSCSYDFKAHSGSEVCVTRCLKNPATGHAVQHSTTCTSAFIPLNCFQKNPYSAGHDDGYHDGYKSGFETGYDRAYRAAYADYYDRGYDSGFRYGYDNGYNSGFNAGMREAEYDDRASEEEGEYALAALIPAADAGAAGGAPAGNAVAEGYRAGYREGYSFATALRVGR